MEILKGLKERFDKEIAPILMKEMGLTNVHQVPRLDKVVINMGVGEAAHDSKKLKFVVDDLAAIAGQKPVITKAKQSIAGFKIRQGMGVGVKVTLRRDRMYGFIERLVNIALPRVRDFRGLNPKSFDGHGNYSLGIKEHIIFTEVNYDRVDKIRGMDIVVCTTSDSNAAAFKLLSAINFPFIK